jgi:predicted O-methyltransferase YrrM
MNHFYQNIHGWFDFQKTYTKMVNQHGDGAHFVEIGTFLGRSLSYLAVEIINSGKNIRLDAVDTWEGSPLEPFQQQQNEVMNKTLYDDFLKNIEPVKNHINVVKSDSVEASKLYEDESLDFIFIDASHHYEFVKADIQAWYPKLKKGGYIGGHDYDPPSRTPNGIHGVFQAVNEIFPGDFDVVDEVSWIHLKK